MNKFWVIDTNVIIIALLNPEGNEKTALSKPRKNGIILVSPLLKAEYLRVLSRNKFDKYISLETRMALYSALLDEALELHPKLKVEICRDPTDNILLEIAFEAQADAIISGDNDLLVLHPFHNTPILSASNFIDFI